MRGRLPQGPEADVARAPAAAPRSGPTVSSARRLQQSCMETGA
jgi:hypothetical protein